MVHIIEMQFISYADKIKQNLKTLFHKKREIAFSLMDEKKQIVFQLIAPLLHLNHPKLVGYIENAPSGIFNYKLSQKSQYLVKEQFDLTGLEYQKLVATTFNNKISALYSIGSTGTLGQTNASDIDVWVCLEVCLSEEEKDILRQKANLIENWAHSFGTELNFYLVDVNRFKQNHHDCLTKENCGSAQHVLLLEEFYRSAFRLAGKWLMWYLVPLNLSFNQKTYSSHDHFLNNFIECEQLDLDEWLDFGQLTHLSQKEYFSSCLWQLYKCIDSPFKSTLKTILLESYVINKQSSFIAFNLLDKIQNDEISEYHYLDGYVMLFDAIQNYLYEIRDEARLWVAKRCFYLKILTGFGSNDFQEPPNWKQKLVRDYILEWNWNDEFIRHIEQFKSWTIFEVRYLDDVILKTIMSTYRKLLEFARINNIESAINLTDLSLLTRKLYAVYEESPQKIKRVNQNFMPYLYQSDLTFVFVQRQSAHLSGWYLYNHAPKIIQFIGHRLVHYTERLVKMITWAFLNRILDENTKLYCFNNGRAETNSLAYILKQLANNLSQNYEVDDKILLASSQVFEVLIFINSESGALNSSSTDFDEFEMQTNSNFIKEIDIIYKNSWGEVKHFYFSGSLALLDALRIFVNQFNKMGQFPQKLKVISVPELFRFDIEKKITQIFTKAIHYRLENDFVQKARFMPIRLNGQSWYLFFERFGISAHQFNNKLALFDAVTTNKITGKVRKIGEVRDVLPSAIDEYAKEDTIQFFFHDHEKEFDLYILDEKNQVEILRNCHTDKNMMIKEASQFYILTNERAGSTPFMKSLFNIPEFYQIMPKEGDNQVIIPYHLC